MAEGEVYQISCKDCKKKMILVKSNLWWEKIEQHTNDVKFGRTNNAITYHVEESSHQIDWDKTICLEKREEALPQEGFRKLLYKGEQNKAHTFKWWVSPEHVIWNGERSMVEEGKSVYLKGDNGCHLQFNLTDDIVKTSKYCWKKEVLRL